MKKEFKSDISLIFLGRFFTIVSLFVFVYLFKLIYTIAFVKQDVLLSVGLLVMLVVVGFYYKNTIFHTLYPLAFGKLVVSDEGIAYCCFLKKPIFISWENCRFCGIEAHQHNVVIMNKCGSDYIYFSKEELLQEYKGKIDKKKNEQGFIKFYPVTSHLCKEVLKYKQADDLECFVNKNEKEIN